LVKEYETALDDHHSPLDGSSLCRFLAQRWTALQGKAPCDVPLANVRLTALKSEEFVLAMLGFAVREDWRQRLANNQVPTLTHT